jgi:hypothetical protein
MPSRSHSNTHTPRRNTPQSSRQHSQWRLLPSEDSGPSRGRPLPRTPRNQSMPSPPPAYQQRRGRPRTQGHRNPRPQLNRGNSQPLPAPSPCPSPPLSSRTVTPSVPSGADLPQAIITLPSPPESSTSAPVMATGPPLLQVTLLISCRGLISQMGTAYVHPRSRLQHVGGRLLVIQEFTPQL